ncbi:MAG: undecaprenyl-phosphate galactose phosphotransferase WbaP [Alphaproteobacteria bacterium]|nr:undecaprenyl-phosphate galactose phosphotransferase WbaP [Alphaproteobacteria bacterium]
MTAPIQTAEEQTLSAPIPTKNVEQATAQLGHLLNEIQSEPDFFPRILPFRYSVARVLRGYRMTDALALAVGFSCAWILAITINAVFFGRHDLEHHATTRFLIKASQIILLGSCVIVWFTHKGHYRMRMPFWTETKQIVEAMTFAMLADTFFHSLAKQDFSRLWLVSGWMIGGLVMIGFRSLWRRNANNKGKWKVRALLVGKGETANETRRAVAEETGLGFDIAAQIDNLPAAFEAAGRSWQNLCAHYDTDYVVIALDGADLMKAEQAFAQLMREDVPFSVSPPMHNVPVFGMVPQYFFNHDVMLLTHNHGLNQRFPRTMKRTFDIVVSSLALLALSPVLLTVAFIVRKDGGPALFGHRRLGMLGKSFPCLKFRSMAVNSDVALKKLLEESAEAREEWERDHKLRNDPRVTPIGKFLRRTSIDELPQLINVLRGDMSIVGPRPIIVAETQKYDNDISHYYRVRPGITGLWQVSGRNDVSYAQRVRMDSWYVRNWSLWHDIAIICKTIPAVFKRDGAY